MNTTIQAMFGHRSIRKFTDDTISDEQLNTIIAAGIAASSSSMIQATSIIRITDPEKRAALAHLAGDQPYVAQAAEFLVFCIDYQRHYSISSEIKPEYTELALIGAIDSGIMAQNCLLAAESMGLGGVYIGGLRNNPHEVDALLKLPPYSAILFGMCLGVPAQDPQSKPRLPMALILHENEYQPLSQPLLAEYDQQTVEYYQQRSSHNKQQDWSSAVTKTLSKESRPFIAEYFHSKGLMEK
ncbi:oxygen-insensitive NADPH nitroreductase [Photobacterium kishitanii]|uniref:oxygen-insensitive NADPH nitroreductase n=1 Tax=Photobacterium kishitanii TaxID=318456 RepID=UPI0005D37C68|nr:oxygen-insensitive NADPH nitroreductase [Photobacterium kishitanii]KJG11169.1 NADPH-flavin oxidoreductase [Photobacterium kishitanii]PSV07365.1 oxygen-insensitive NADPH nitroreductase [Photobacterium kishitanii]PSV77057.1 oxygen-insensitive NADPH nitroreductase [Photobacterium kishitanii]